MKKVIFPVLLCLISSVAFAQVGPETFANEKVATEVESLGAMGGLAYACNNTPNELKTYEAIITDFIYNASLTQSEEFSYKRLYLEAKEKFSEAQKRNPQASCNEIKNSFLRQRIFWFKKNPDGSMVTPEGKLLKRGAVLPF